MAYFAILISFGFFKVLVEIVARWLLLLQAHFLFRLGPTRCASTTITSLFHSYERIRLEWCAFNCNESCWGYLVVLWLGIYCIIIWIECNTHVLAILCMQTAEVCWRQ